MAAGQPDEANELADLVGPFWSGASVCGALGSDPDGLGSMSDAGKVLGLVTSDGVTVYPASQFRAQDGRTVVDPALVPVFHALRGTGWATAVLLHTPAPELDDQTPLNWLAQGGSPQAVADLARVVAREWRQGDGSEPRP